MRVVHVFFSASEEGRVTEIIEQLKADKVYVFLFERNGKIIDINVEQTENNLAALKKTFINLEIEKIGVDFTDYYGIIDKISNIIIKEIGVINKNVGSELKIILNVGTGSKMSSIACMDAVRVWPECFLYGYYGYSENYDQRRKIQHIGEQKYFRPPVLKFSGISTELIKTIKIIAEISLSDNLDRTKGFVYNQELLDRLKVEKMIEETKPSDVSKGSESAELMALRNRYVKPLEEAGYIDVEKKGRTKVISLTEEGNNLYKFYKSLITIRKDDTTGLYEIIQ